MSTSYRAVTAAYFTPFNNQGVRGLTVSTPQICWVQAVRELCPLAAEASESITISCSVC